MSLLTDIVPSKARKVVYAAYAIALTVIGVLQIVVDGDPDWLARSQDVVLYLGIAFGATAASNISHIGARKDGDSSTGYAAGNDAPDGVTPGEPVRVEPSDLA